MKDASYIYDADSLDEHQKRLKVIVKRYRRKEPDATNFYKEQIYAEIDW